jgi:hypothetical protein
LGRFAFLANTTWLFLQDAWESRGSTNTKGPKLHFVQSVLALGWSVELVLFLSNEPQTNLMAPAIQQVQVVVEATAVTNRSRWFRVRVLLLTSRMSTRQQEREAQSDSIVQVEKSRLVQQVQVVVGDRASFSSNQWVKVVSNPTSCYRPAGCRLIQVDSTAGTRSPIGFHSPRLAYSSLMIIQTSRRHEQKGTFLTILASGLGIN